MFYNFQEVTTMASDFYLFLLCICIISIVEKNLLCSLKSALFFCIMYMYHHDTQIYWDMTLMVALQLCIYIYSVTHCAKLYFIGKLY